MSILQEPPAPPLPVICDFFFEQTGPPGIATYDGDTYPYPPLPSDKGSDARYAWGTTPVFLAVEFFATREKEEREEKEAREKWVKEEEATTITKKEREEKEATQTTKRKLAERTQGRVTAPPGIEILEYFWDFGDGFAGHGPIVTHTYEVPDPTTSISLTVLDSLGREFSTSKALSLLVVDFGYIYPRIRGKNTETPPKRQEVEASGDFALSIEGTPTRTWIERGGEAVREQEEKAVSSDRVSVQTSFVRHTRDTSHTSDTVTRTLDMARRGGKPPHEDISLSADTARSNVHRYSLIEDESLSSDSTGSPIHQRPLRAKLSVVGKLPKQFSLAKKLKATLTSSGKLPY